MTEGGVAGVSETNTGTPSTPSPLVSDEPGVAEGVSSCLSSLSSSSLLVITSPTALPISTAKGELTIASAIFGAKSSTLIPIPAPLTPGCILTTIGAPGAPSF